MPAWRFLLSQADVSAWFFGVDLSDLFGNLHEGKPKTIYYRPIPASRASTA